MRVLVDTSVWSLALRKQGPGDHPAVRKLTVLLKAHEDVVLMGLVLQEILQGLRTEEAFRRVSGDLNSFPLLELVREDFVEAARLHRRCAARGVGASTVDCLIAVAAIRHDCVLLTTDSAFNRIAGQCPLQLM